MEPKLVHHPRGLEGSYFNGVDIGVWVLGEEGGDKGVEEGFGSASEYSLVDVFRFIDLYID